MNDTPFCRATALKFRKSYKIYQRKKQGLIIQVFPISSVTVSLISFLSIDIQACFVSDICPFSLSLRYHYPITGNLDGKQELRLYTSVD